MDLNQNSLKAIIMPLKEEKNIGSVAWQGATFGKREGGAPTVPWIFREHSLFYKKACCSPSIAPRHQIFEIY